MDGKECMAILRKVGISRDEFANMMGIKRSTMRTCVHGNRISRKMVLKLRELNGDKFLRLIEFRDGTHGKVRCKPGKYWIGDELRVREGERGVWEIV